MVGRGDTSKSFNENKVVSNIDAPRNKPFRDKRAKEIEVERIAKMQAAELEAVSVKPARTKKKIIEQEGVVSILARVQGTGALNDDRTERQNVESIARSKDGMLHVNKSDKYSYHVTDAQSGLALATLGSKKSAIKFLNASTRSDGKASSTLRRYMEYTSTRGASWRALPEEKRKMLSRAADAVSKLKTRIGYD